MKVVKDKLPPSVCWATNEEQRGWKSLLAHKTGNIIDIPSIYQHNMHVVI